MPVKISRRVRLPVLPAVLHKLGDRVDRGRIPLFRGRPSEDGAWAHVIGFVLRRPLSSLLVSGGLLVLAAVPAASLQTKLPNLTDLPHDLAIVRTYDRIQRAFPGSQTPAVVVIEAPNVTSPRMRAAYAEFRKRAIA